MFVSKTFIGERENKNEDLFVLLKPSGLKFSIGTLKETFLVSLNKNKYGVQKVKIQT